MRPNLGSFVQQAHRDLFIVFLTQLFKLNRSRKTSWTTPYDAHVIVQCFSFYIRDTESSFCQRAKHLCAYALSEL